MFKIDVNSDRFVWLTNKLEKLPRSAFPNAVRGTLNGMALDVKKNTMPESSSKEFINRDKNFFKAKSRVNFARGFNLKTMESMIGFVGNDQAVEDLEQQEKGGIITGRSFIPTNLARISKSSQRRVRKRERTSNIKNIVRTNKSNPLPKAVHKAGVKGYVLHNDMLFRVDRINGRKFKLSAIYSYKSNRSVTVKPTNFMEKATKKTYKKAPIIYKKEAERQFSRFFK